MTYTVSAVVSYVLTVILYVAACVLAVKTARETGPQILAVCSGVAHIWATFSFIMLDVHPFAKFASVVVLFLHWVAGIVPFWQIDY